MARAEIVENGGRLELVVTEASTGQVQRFELGALSVGLLAETAARAAANALRRAQPAVNSDIGEKSCGVSDTTFKVESRRKA